jgi:hypothetical protein
MEKVTLPSNVVGNILQSLNPSDFPMRLSHNFRDSGIQLRKDIAINFFDDLLIYDPDILFQKYAGVKEVILYLYYLHPKELIHWIYMNDQRLYRMLFISLSSATKSLLKELNTSQLVGLPLIWLLNRKEYDIVSYLNNPFLTSPLQADESSAGKSIKLYNVIDGLIKLSTITRFDELVPISENDDIYHYYNSLIKNSNVLGKWDPIREVKNGYKMTDHIRTCFIMFKNRYNDSVLNEEWLFKILNKFLEDKEMMPRIIDLIPLNIMYTEELINVLIRYFKDFRHRMSGTAPKVTAAIVAAAATVSLDMVISVVNAFEKGYEIVSFGYISDIVNIISYLYQSELISTQVVLTIAIKTGTPDILTDDFIKLVISNVHTAAFFEFEYVRFEMPMDVTENNMVTIFDRISLLAPGMFKLECLECVLDIAIKFAFVNPVFHYFATELPDMYLMKDSYMSSDHLNRYYSSLLKFSTFIPNSLYDMRTVFIGNIIIERNKDTKMEIMTIPSVAVKYLLVSSKIKYDTVTENVISGMNI